jgi:maltose alpha-D-glucosyltransferase/alpha-amylase
VAGMLRSFDYAAYAAREQIPSEHSVERNILSAFLDDWRSRSSQAFLSAYRQALGDCSVFPREPAHGYALIELFILEKALYEIRYELDHRPDWAVIPLQGVLELVKG